MLGVVLYSPPHTPGKAWNEDLPALTYVIGSPILPLIFIHLAFLLGNLVEN